MSGQAGPPPRFQLHSPAVDFVENRLPQYHPAFAHPNAIFDPASNQFAALTQPEPMALTPSGWPPIATAGAELPPRPLPSEVEAMKFWTTIFPKAKARLQEVKEPDHRSEIDLSIRDKATWEEVHEQLRRARDVYDGRDQGWFGKIKRGTRKVGNAVATPIQQLTKLIPDHPISAPVLGAVNLLLDAWKEAAKVPAEADAQFKNLKAVFADIDQFCTMFQNDPNIFDASVDLVWAIFKAVESAIGFYISPQVARFIKATLQADEYQQPLRQCLGEIETYGKTLNEHAQKSFMWATMMSNITTRKMVAALQQQGDNMLTAMNRMYWLISECGGHDHFHAVASSTSSRAPSPQPEFLETPCTPQLIWEAIGISDLDDDDMLFIMDRAGGLPFEDRGRAEQVVATPEFRDWMVNREMTKLLVHGDFDSADYVSPLSVLCTTIVAALRSRPGFVTLVFFCGRHVSSNEEDTGGVALIRSFIAQLLRQYPSCPKTLDSSVSLDEVEAGNLKHLTELFSILARQLPPATMLVCVIDGIMFYERPAFRNDMEEVLGAILELAEDDGRMTASVKILLTSPKETRSLLELFRSSRALLSMAAIPHTGRGPTGSGVADRVAGQLERELGGSTDERE